MPVLATCLTTLRNQLDLEKSWNSSSSKISLSMASRHTCLCCSNLLLRHISSGKLYWRCSHCYQAMPVMEDAEPMPLPVVRERLFEPLLISPMSPKQTGLEQENYQQFISSFIIIPIVVHSG